MTEHHCSLFKAPVSAKSWTCPECKAKWKHVETKKKGYIGTYVTLKWVKA